LFGGIYAAWSNHLNVRTCPEDWWLPLISKVAIVVDNHANRGDLRNLFVGGRRDRQAIVVECPNFSIYDTDYTYLFNGISDGIKERIMVPDFVPSISCDFSTTTPDQLVGSQIALMKSLQKYFKYKMIVRGCGIKGLEMCGTEADWKHLGEKLLQLKKVLEPVESILCLDKFFTVASKVFENLLKTYLGDELMATWWADVLIESKEVKYGPSGMSRGTVDHYNGWLVQFCTGGEYTSIEAENFSSGKIDELSGLSSCPMKIVDRLRKIEDHSTLIAGILGFRVCSESKNGVTSLQPMHGWCLMLRENSPLRIVPDKSWSDIYG